MYKNISDSDPAGTNTFFSYLPVVLVGACLLIVGIYVDHLNSVSINQRAYNELLNKVSVVRARIEGTINSNAQVVKGLVAAISTEPDMSQERFVSLSTPLMAGYSQIRNIAAAPELIIEYMNPVEGNEAAIGLDYRTIPTQYESVKRVVESGKLILDGPVDLVQGGVGLIARIPVYTGVNTGETPKLWGIVASVIDIDRFFDASGLHEKDLDMEILIQSHASDGKLTGVIFGEKNILDQNPVTVDITLPNDSWKLSAIPQGGWPDVSDSLLFRTGLLSAAVIILAPMFILVRNIHKRKESEAFLKMLFKRSPMGIALNDLATGDFIQVSDALLEHTGYTREEFLNLSYWDITPEKYKEDEAEQLRSLNEVGEYGPYEKEYIHKDGHRYPVILKGLRITDDEGREMIWSFIEDISKRKQAERALQRSQKMDAIGHLSGGIAHDFNNIMGIILGNLELLTSEVASKPEEARERISKIYKSGQRAADLTKQLLSFSREKDENLEVTAINQLVENIQNLIARSVTPEIDVSLRLEERLWFTNINPGEFEDAMLNLCINARDAMSGNGRLTIATRNEVLDESRCDTLVDATPGEYVVLSITDTGTGIEPDQLDHIFEPFFTTKEEGKGTGLGLSMVYGFVHRTDGFIDVDSEIGVGTTINLYLPRVIKSDDQVQPKQNEDTAIRKGTEKILLVDDEELLLELAESMLEDMGYEVVTATSAIQALEKLHEHPDVDLLFSDVVMPGAMNGFELAVKAKKASKGLKVLLTSGNTGKAKNYSTSDDAVQQGLIKNILSKPYTNSELAISVRATLDAAAEH